MSLEQWTDHNWDTNFDSGDIDLGHGMTIALWYLDEEHTRPGGFWEWHNCPGGKSAGGGMFDVPGTAEMNNPKWTLESIDPLTISPSVLCRTCGWHGFIRNGRWEPC